MDIVDELRATPETVADPDMIFEAADEIERLRAELKKHDAWLGQAHCLCSDLKVPHGHIEDRLFEAIGKVTGAMS